MHRSLYDILADHVILGPLRLKEFRNEDTTPHIYEWFIISWGMFPHHDQVPIYFSKQIYVEFVLDMRLDYTNMPLLFYGYGRGHNFDHPMTHKDPTHGPPPSRLVPFPSQRVVLSIELEDPS